MMDSIRKWAEQERKRLKINQTSFGKILGISQPQAQKRLAGDVEFSFEEINLLENHFGSKSPIARQPEKINFKLISEYDVQVSAGDGAVIYEEAVKSHWPLPTEYLEGYLGITHQDLGLVEVQGDSMEPTLSTGDRALVNFHDKNFSQPGIFVVFDGYGTVIKRVERIMSENGGVRLISDNPRHSTYETSDETVQIVGRVIWVGKRI